MTTVHVTVHAAAAATLSSSSATPAPDVFLLEDERNVRFNENLVVAVVSFVFFWLVFIASWVVSSRRVPEFNSFTPALKADWCSRVNSTIHAVAVVVGVSVALASIEWGTDFMPMSSIRTANFIFSVAIGYFLSDLIVIVAWPIPMQAVFVTHHIVAVVPYLINNFVSCCGAAQFGLLLFLLVELATLPLNARGFLESIGREDTKNHTRAIYVTYVVWAVSRMVLPVFLLYSFWAYTFPSKRNQDMCFYPNLIGAHIIAFFCVGVFFFVHTPELLKIRKDKKKNLLPTTAEHEEEPAPSAPVSTRDPKKIKQLASGSYEEVDIQGVIVQPSSRARAFS